MFGKDKNPKKKKEGKGFLGALGIEAEKAPTEDESKKGSRHEKMVLIWKYIRSRIDKGAEEYFQTGESRILKEYVAGPTRETMMTHLDSLRSQGVIWAQPDRSTKTNPEIEIVTEQLDSKGHPTSFVVREAFNDFSICQGAMGNRREAPGNRRILQAKVEVDSSGDYRLLQVIEIKGS